MCRNRSYKFCSRECQQIAYGARLAERIPSRVCALAGCGEEFQPRKREQRCCSEPHGKKLWHVEHPDYRQPYSDRQRDAYHRRRAQKAGTAVSDRPVVKSEIAIRDKNRCHLCGERVSRKPYPHPMSASLDHVVPLSQGGDHVPENVRLAHLSCNVAKGNGGGNEQLLLIG